MDKFSERLKELRLDRELSQAQLARATGLSHTAIVYWENKLRVPSAKAIIVLAKFFKVTSDYLLGLTDEC